MAYVVAFANHKKGVGKTTTVTNTAWGLMKAKKRVLVIDCDPQGNASMTLGTVSPFEQPRTIEHLFRTKEIDFTSCAVKSKYEGIDLIASNINSAVMAAALGPNDSKRFLGLRNKYDEKAKKTYDYILVDCPPSPDGVFLVNSMTVADFYVIPVEAESMYALQGIDSLIKSVLAIIDGTNPKLKLLGGLVTMFDSRTIAGKLMVETIKSYFGPDRVFKTTIHRNTAINKASIVSRCACDLDQRSSGCLDYRKFAKELIHRVEHWKDQA